MPADDGYDIIILSDLHLSAGYDPATGTYSRREDFFFDAAFGRLLGNLRERARREGRRWRLVLLGDVVDLLQVEAPEAGRPDDEPDSSCEATCEKLRRIAVGHPEFFAALGEFAAEGFPVDIVPGNHDIELIRPDAQQTLRELTAEYSNRPEAASRISFYPWIYCIPGVLYAEHGHQYDEDNNFLTMLSPWRDHDPEQIELPLGSYFVTYLFNHIEAIDPFADNVKPPTRYMMWSFRTHPVVALTALRFYLRFLFRVLPLTNNRSDAEDRKRREQYREAVVRPYAESVGLSPDLVIAIDRLSPMPALSSRYRLLRALVLDPLLASIPVVGTLVALYMGLRRFRLAPGSLILSALGIFGLVWRDRRLLRPLLQPTGYMFRAASNIDRLLKSRGVQVPVYVFGHTHVAEQHLLSADGKRKYINSGTWTPMLPGQFELLGGRERFSFVQITRSPRSRQPIAQLFYWNDLAGRHEPLPLLAP